MFFKIFFLPAIALASMAAAAPIVGTGMSLPLDYKTRHSNLIGYVELLRREAQPFVDRVNGPSGDFNVNIKREKEDGAHLNMVFTLPPGSDPVTD